MNRLLILDILMIAINLICVFYTYAVWMAPNPGNLVGWVTISINIAFCTLFVNEIYKGYWRSKLSRIS